MEKMNRRRILKISFGIVAFVLASGLVWVIVSYGHALKQDLLSCYRPLPPHSISNTLALAIISQEDRRFFEHQGIDWKEVSKSFSENLSRFKILRGGSTIDMQVYRLCFQKQGEKSVRQKLEQFLGATALNKRFTKAQILEAYIQRAPMGLRAGLMTHGFIEGGHHYFHKKIEDLNYFQEWALVLTLRSHRRLNPFHTGDLKKLGPKIGKSLLMATSFQYNYQARLNEKFSKMNFIFQRDPRYLLNDKNTK